MVSSIYLFVLPRSSLGIDQAKQNGLHRTRSSCTSGRAVSIAKLEEESFDCLLI